MFPLRVELIRDINNLRVISSRLAGAGIRTPWLPREEAALTKSPRLMTARFLF